MRSSSRLLLAGLALAISWALHAAPLRAKDQVLFMPGTASVLPDGQVELDVHAWLYRKSHIRGLNRMLASYLDIDLSQLAPAARLRFSDRTGLFHTESTDERVIGIVLDGSTQQPLALPPTEDNGRTNARVTVPASSRHSTDALVRFHAWTAAGDTRRFPGQAVLVPPEGLSVVSDIDDTIKQTHVRDRHEMLLNTFARRFEPVAGMAKQFRAMAMDAGTRFHYVSGSPLQLYPPLADFLRDGGFPQGSVHLRESTSWRSLLTMDATRDHKLGTIERLMDDFPRRRFLLVGDSGESDPETYAELARRHPERIAAIVIRDVTHEGRASPRYASTFEGVDPARWHVLVDAEAWPEVPR